MISIRRFEDLEVWQKSRQLVQSVYRLSSAGELARDFGLRSQLRRAAVSVMPNIAEGFERGGNKEFVRFLVMAKGSCGEVRSQLYVGLDQSYISQLEFEAVGTKATEVSRMVSGLIKSLRSAAERDAE